MVSITEAAREIILRQPFLEDALARNIINYNNLAKEILEEVELLTATEGVKISSIAMALRRLGERYVKKYDHTIQKKLSDFVDKDTNIKYDLFEISVALRPHDDISKLINSIFSEVKAFQDDFLSITKGRSELTVITNLKYKDKIKKLCSKFRIVNETYDLAVLMIRIPEDSLTTPGLFYLLSKTLTLKGINIAEIVSTFSELQFILDEDDVNDAAKAIRKLLKTAPYFE